LEVFACAKVLAETFTAIKTVLTVIEVSNLFSPDVLQNLGSNTVQTLVESLLDDHAVKETRKKDFLMLRGIWVVGARCTRHERVELSKHEARGKL
jgi:hypothetical protein